MENNRNNDINNSSEHENRIVIDVSFVSMNRNSRKQVRVLLVKGHELSRILF